MEILWKSYGNQMEIIGKSDGNPMQILGDSYANPMHFLSIFGELCGAKCIAHQQGVVWAE